MIYKLNKQPVKAIFLKNPKNKGDEIPLYTLNETNDLMKTDILENESSYIILIDLPGFDKEEIKIIIQNNYIEVYANRLEHNRFCYLYQERYYGNCYRKFFLNNINSNEIVATYKQGVLELNIPKIVVNIITN